MALARTALLYLARQEGLKDAATRISPFRRVAERFVAGESLANAAQRIRDLVQRGFYVSFDHLNEAVSSREETHGEVRTYTEILDTIAQLPLPNTNVSIKLTQFGLGMDDELAFQNARQVVQHAKGHGNFVRVDMESSAFTDRTLALFRRLRGEFELNDVGIVLQAYLRRTEADLDSILKLPARVRLCKGAYLEPPELAFPEKPQVDANFVRLMQRLLDSGVYHGIATHDPKMLDATIAHAQKKGLPRDAFEFQMLYGVRRDLQDQLLQSGWRVRIYVPFGKHWYPYFMRRLAERPANVWFVLKNFFKG